MSLRIQVQDLTKTYRLGLRGAGTLAEDVNQWWRRLRHPALARQEAEEARKTIRALHEVSFDVSEGEVLGVIGRNGAGKSTLLKILSRVTAPTAGEVRVRGRLASLLEVGAGFHPELTGRENMYLNGAILGMRRSEVRARLDEMIAFAELERFVDTPVKRYSSGMYVRLAFAVAAHLEADVLLVDEVLAVGDVEFQTKCLRKMEEVSEAGRTVLLVSHNMAVISSLCPRCLLLEQGRLVADGPTSETLSRYLLGVGEREAQVDLRESPHRRGDGAARVLSARMLDEHGCPTTEFMMGRPWTLEFEVDVKPPGRKTMFAFTLSTDQGVRLLNWLSIDDGQPVEACSGRVRIRATVSSLPFYPGDYAVERIWAGSPSAARDCFDEVHPLLGFRVSQGDVGGAARAYHRRMGLVVAPVEASIQPLEDES